MSRRKSQGWLGKPRASGRSGGDRFLRGRKDSRQALPASAQTEFQTKHCRVTAPVTTLVGTGLPAPENTREREGGRDSLGLRAGHSPETFLLDSGTGTDPKLFGDWTEIVYHGFTKSALL